MSGITKLPKLPDPAKCKFSLTNFSPFQEAIFSVAILLGWSQSLFSSQALTREEVNAKKIEEGVEDGDDDDLSTPKKSKKHWTIS